jgi:hypothetical protein
LACKTLGYRTDSIKPAAQPHRIALAAQPAGIGGNLTSSGNGLAVTITIQHRLLLRAMSMLANVSQMYAECFDKVLYHVNSRILKCKMTNVITKADSLSAQKNIDIMNLLLFLVEVCGDFRSTCNEKVVCKQGQRHLLQLTGSITSSNSKYASCLHCIYKKRGRVPLNLATMSSALCKNSFHFLKLLYFLHLRFICRS